MKETGKDMVNVILDTAGQKGTVKWTVINSLWTRCTRYLDDHHKASKILTGSVPKFDGDKTAFLEDASKIVSYAQGFVMCK